jgi:hypothetical protein
MDNFGISKEEEEVELDDTAINSGNDRPHKCDP